MKRKYTRNIQKLRRTQGCMTDCVAYIFNLHPENVPYFIYPREDWAKRLRSFFKKRGLVAIWVKTKDIPKRGTYMVVGDSLKWKTYSHAVVYKNGKCIYDPNYPSKWKENRITHYLKTYPIKKI